MDTKLVDALNNNILILDGGFGTMLQTYATDDESTKNDSPGCNDLLSVIRPDIVADIHHRYLEAGADIIETNSFNANAISLTDYGLQHRAYEIAKAAAMVAREAADKYTTPDKPRFVAGSIGPTNKTLSMSSDVTSPAMRDVTFELMYEAYHDQVRGLIDGGADILIVETVFDTLNAKAALSAIRDISPDIPIIISATLSDASGRMLTGQSVEGFVASVAHAKPLALGLNCGFGAKHLLPHVRRLAAVSPVRISVHPNAGLPNVLGQYEETPEKFVTDLKPYLDEGLLNIVGGCCGTTPEHIKALADLAKDYKPRKLQPQEHILTLSGLEPLTINADTNLVNIGERTNVAGSAKFAKLIRENKYDEALTIAKAQVNAGAQIVDVCMDDAMIDGTAAMGHFLNLMASEPEIARVPVMIDSSKWEVIVAGLQATQGKSIVNSISLKEGEEKFLERARHIMNYGAAAVVMLFDEKGQADTYSRKIEVAQRAYNLLVGIGFAPEDIIFDPNILAVATGIEAHDRFAKDFIDATRWIKQNLPHVKVSGGVSNLSFAFRGNNQVRKAMHAVFLYHAIGAGMDMAIVNPQMVQMYDEIDPTLLQLVEDVILYRRPDAAERLIEHAKSLIDTDSKVQPEQNQQKWRSLRCEERITHALLKGDTDYIVNDILEAYNHCGDAPKVIDTILMPAMAKVGALFGEGKMFLPQVVKSARVMKEAVATLEPYFKSTQSSTQGATSAPVIVIATVKGDVHDIGKNIVSVVLSCNGYDVHDLGVMVPPEHIISEAKRLNATAICLSGLITPSLEEMINVAKEAERQGLNTPILIGGATTSALHTAVKIAPVTNAPVIHSTDAADNASTISALVSPDREAFLDAVRQKQNALREQYHNKSQSRPKPCPCCHPHIAKTNPATKVYERLTILEPKIEDLIPKINWSFFFAGWGMPGKYPDILSNPEKGEDAKGLYDDAQTMLKYMIDNECIKPLGFIQTFNAEANGDDLMLTSLSTPEKSARMPMLRSENGECVTDFVHQSDNRVTLFTLTAGIGCADLSDSLRKQGDEYGALMAKLLCDRLAEAFAETVLGSGCRLAIGYPSIPDHTLKREVFDMLEVEEHSPLRLTESYMITPAETVCGLHVANGHYFDLGHISDQQLNAYAQRRCIQDFNIRNLGLKI